MSQRGKGKSTVKTDKGHVKKQTGFWTHPLDDVQSAALLLHVNLYVVIALESGGYIKPRFLQDLQHVVVLMVHTACFVEHSAPPPQN